MIALVDYGLGNITAFTNIYYQLGLDVVVAETVDDIRKSNRVILPGVGSFDWAMKCLNESGLREELDLAVLEEKKPVLGVCVGMQMMAQSSEEGKTPGLGWLNADVVKLDTTLFTGKTHLPHMGWNSLDIIAKDPLFAGISKPEYYFLHSYVVRPFCEKNVIAKANYGESFAAALKSDNIYGTQFHPEKSHEWGVRLLKNFAGIN